jgi:acetyltransferase-like isoleucine patch superfamily enzyme
LYFLTWPFVRIGTWLGFRHIDYAYIHGNRTRLHLGARCSTTDTLFNVVSGEIWVGDDTVFAHGCQVLTGQHRFARGKRASLATEVNVAEVPSTGHDIRIGSGCFIGSGAIILANVEVGDHSIIGANTVVTASVPAHSFVAGAPGRVVRSLLPE